MADEAYEKHNRLAEALAIRGVKQSELCAHTGILKSSINGWIKQKYQPKTQALYAMAKYLDVSELWLAGYDVPMERKKRPGEQAPVPETVGELSPEEQQLILRYRELSNSEKDMICRSMGVARQHDMSRRISPQKRMVLKLKRGR